MLLGQVVSRSEAVATAADDDGVVAGLGLGPAPLGRPAALARQAALQERQGRKALHAERLYLVRGRAPESCRVGRGPTTIRPPPPLNRCDIRKCNAAGKSRAHYALPPALR